MSGSQLGAWLRERLAPWAGSVPDAAEIQRIEAEIAALCGGPIAGLKIHAEDNAGLVAAYEAMGQKAPVHWQFAERGGFVVRA